MEHNPIVVLITASGAQEARYIADELLAAHLAACVNILPEVSSHYWWQGKIESAREALLMAKSRAELLDDIIKHVKKLHSYEVPEIIALQIAGGNTDYLNWIKNETKPQTRS